MLFEDMDELTFQNVPEEGEDETDDDCGDEILEFWEDKDGKLIGVSARYVCDRHKGHDGYHAEHDGPVGELVAFWDDNRETDR